MPIHDWSRVVAGIHHDFHHTWITELKKALNDILPPAYYALAEQHAGGLVPDVLTLQRLGADTNGNGSPGGVGLLVEQPQVQLVGEVARAEEEPLGSAIAIHHVSDDRVVAVVEVVSASNKSRHGLLAFVSKAVELLDAGVHFLVLDVLPPGEHDPFGMHAAIWEALSGEERTSPFSKPLTLVSYESAKTIRYYLEPVAVGDSLIGMPLYLEPGAHVRVPLEATYQRAWEALPRVAAAR